MLRLQVIAFILLAAFLTSCMLWPEMILQRPKATDFQYHDSYFVTLNLHYLLIPILWLLMLVWIYVKILPRIPGRYIQNIHFLLTVTALVLVIIALLKTDIGALTNLRPVDINTVTSLYEQQNLAFSIGGWIFLATQTILLIYLLASYIRQKKSPKSD